MNQAIAREKNEKHSKMNPLYLYNAITKIDLGSVG